MKWVNLAVSPKFSWPNKLTEIPFNSSVIVLQPLSQNLSASVSVYCKDGLTFDEGGTILSRFLSVLSWSKDAGINELFIGGSNNPKKPGLSGRRSDNYTGWEPETPHDYLYLPKINDSKGDLALALYREGLSVNSFPFAFLSFFKILNISFNKGNEQKNWINNNFSNCCSYASKGRLEELMERNENIGDYLYKSGRCAIAHAYGNPVIDPDKYNDKKRLELDLPLIKDLSRHLIEKEFNILSGDSFWLQLREGKIESSCLYKAEVSERKVVYTPC